MGTVWNILIAVIRVLLPVLIDRLERPRLQAEDGRRDGELRSRLQDRVRSTWGKAGAMLLLVALAAPGCLRTRTLYVPDGEPVRLRETIPAAKVWVLDADGKPTAGEMDLPEGWYVLPLGIRTDTTDTE